MKNNDNVLPTKKEFFVTSILFYIFILTMTLLAVGSSNIYIILLLVSLITIFVFTSFFIMYKQTLIDWRFEAFKEKLHFKDELLDLIDNGYKSNNFVVRVDEYLNNDFFVTKIEYQIKFKAHTDLIENIKAIVIETPEDLQLRFKDEKEDKLKRKKLRHEVVCVKKK